MTRICSGTSVSLANDFTYAHADSLESRLAQRGITLENYFGVTHPSEPNYVAAVGGDNFGMDNDNFNQV